MFGIEGKAGQYIELAIGTLLIVVVGLLLIKLILKHLPPGSASG